MLLPPVHYSKWLASKRGKCGFLSSESFQSLDLTVTPWRFRKGTFFLPHKSFWGKLLWVPEKYIPCKGNPVAMLYSDLRAGLSVILPLLSPKNYRFKVFQGTLCQSSFQRASKYLDYSAVIFLDLSRDLKGRAFFFDIMDLADVERASFLSFADLGLDADVRKDFFYYKHKHFL